MKQQTRLKKNPSRETCESIIRRILSAEIKERGKNEHFRQASDFMSYFESLYPASDSLSKQVQRAIKAMDMPKDENGYFVINKTHTQVIQDQELKHLFQISHASPEDLDGCETIFLKTQEGYSDYLIHLLSTSETFEGQYITMTKTCNGILIYTRNKAELLLLLKQLLEEPHRNS